jgi:hypothetical protein
MRQDLRRTALPAFTFTEQCAISATDSNADSLAARATVFDALRARGGHRQRPVMDSRRVARVHPAKLAHQHRIDPPARGPGLPSPTHVRERKVLGSTRLLVMDSRIDPPARGFPFAESPR